MNHTTIASPTALLVAASLATGACGDGLGLPNATLENFADTVTLYAVHGTPIGTPSAFDMYSWVLPERRGAVRIELGYPFDFAFDFDSTGAAVLMPTALFSLPSTAGLQDAEDPFDRVEQAPLDGYVVDSSYVLVEGATILGRSRSQPCSFLGALPRYAKFRVLDVNATARTVLLEVLVNLNCGYRSLEPGVPTS